MIGESRSERQTRLDQADDRRRAMGQYAEITGEPIEYLDEFTFDARHLAKLHWDLGRVPKCLMKGYIPNLPEQRPKKGSEFCGTCGWLRALMNIEGYKCDWESRYRGWGVRPKDEACINWKEK